MTTDPARELAADVTLIPPGSVILPDPRRRGRRALLSVWCWCGRFYTLTPEQAARAFERGERPCPGGDDCGKGDE